MKIQPVYVDAVFARLWPHICHNLQLGYQRTSSTRLSFDNSHSFIVDANLCFIFYMAMRPWFLIFDGLYLNWNCSNLLRSPWTKQDCLALISVISWQLGSLRSISAHWMCPGSRGMEKSRKNKPNLTLYLSRCHHLGVLCGQIRSQINCRKLS